MFAHLRTRSAAIGRRTAFLRPQLVALGGLLLTAACTSAPPSLQSGPDPSDPDVRVAPAAYRSAFSGYSNPRPAEPKPWQQRNERVAPERKP
jgi:hypothetical protein